MVAYVKAWPDTSFQCHEYGQKFFNEDFLLMVEYYEFFRYTISMTTVTNTVKFCNYFVKSVDNRLGDYKIILEEK